MNDVKRLVIVACGVVMAILLCLFIKNSADTSGWKTAYKYHIAITATDKSQFNYDVDSHQGLVLSHGTFYSKGTKFDEMTKEFTYVKKAHQHYTLHTREVCSGSGKKEHCHTEVYYSWDWMGSETKIVSKIAYMGREYSSNIFDLHNFVQSINACDVTAPDTSGFFGTKHGCKNDWGSYYYTDNNDRYAYSAVPLTFSASFLTDTSNGTLANPFSGAVDLQPSSIDQMVSSSTGYKFWDNLGLILGAITLLITGGILGYNWVMADGKWSLTE